MKLSIVLWDLDDTLYGPETNLFSAIKAGSRKALSHFEGIPYDEEMARRHPYVQKYGTNYHGLVTHYPDAIELILQMMFNIRVEEYLPLGPHLDTLQAAFQTCPLRHILFTHAPIEFAQHVLARLGIAGFFEDIYDGRRMRFQSKRDIATHQQVLGALGASGPECIMIEDSLASLKAAHGAGIRTMLITWSRPEFDRLPEYVDYTAPTTLAAIQQLTALVIADVSARKI